MFRGGILRQLGGFDERFFYHCEETDLCCRVWEAGAEVLFYPGAEVTHLGGQSVGRFPIRFALETHRSQYRYFYKHFGKLGPVRIRRIMLLHLRVRMLGYRLVRLFQGSEALRNRLKMYQVLIQWNKRLDPVRFIETGEEPDLGYAPLAPAPKMTCSPLENSPSVLAHN
jgi:GT2 family glycosyltransferase